MVGRSQVPSSSSFHSAGCLAARSGMVGGSFSCHLSGGSASGSGIVSGRDSSQSAGFVASGSGMLSGRKGRKILGKDMKECLLGNITLACPPSQLV